MTITDSWNVFWQRVLQLVRDVYAEWKNEIAFTAETELESLRERIDKESRGPEKRQLEEELRGRESRRENAPPWQIVNIFALYDVARKEFEFDRFLRRVLDKWPPTADDEGGESSRDMTGPQDVKGAPLHANSTEFVLSVALALLALDQKDPHAELRLEWPPPGDFYERLLGESRSQLAAQAGFRSGGPGHRSRKGESRVIRNTVNADGVRYLRIPEIVFRSLLDEAIKPVPDGKPMPDSSSDGGWPDDAWCSLGWGNRVLEAWQKLVDYVRESVDVALLHIDNFEPRFDRHLDRDRYARALVRELMAEDCECTCVTGAAQRFNAKRTREEYLRNLYGSHPSASARDALPQDRRQQLYDDATKVLEEAQRTKQLAGELRHNIRRKEKTCLTKHHLFGWVLENATLWEFVQNAVKGTSGPFRSSGFESSMLRSRLWRTYPELELVSVALHHCPRCGRETVVSQSCPACDVPFHESIVRVTDTLYWIWNDDLVETHPAQLRFEQTAYYRCRGPAGGLVDTALRTIALTKLRESDVDDWEQLGAAIARGKGEPSTRPTGHIWGLLPDEMQQHVLAWKSGAPPHKGEVLTWLNGLLEKARLWEDPSFLDESADPAVRQLARNIREVVSATNYRRHPPDFVAMNRLIIEAVFAGLIKPTNCRNLYRKDFSEQAEQLDPLDGCRSEMKPGQRVTWLHVYKGGPQVRFYASLDDHLASTASKSDDED